MAEVHDVHRAVLERLAPKLGRCHLGLLLELQRFGDVNTFGPLDTLEILLGSQVALAEFCTVGKLAFQHILFISVFSLPYDLKGFLFFRFPSFLNTFLQID